MMNRLVVRWILLCLLGSITLMTYIVMKQSDTPWEAVRKPRNPHHPPVAKPSTTTKHSSHGIHVAYPVEEVAGMQDVISGRVDKNISSKSNLSAGQFNESFLLPSVKGFFEMPHTPGENIVSMTLYGQSMRYTVGAIRNAELIKENFPGWKLRIYTEDPAGARHGGIPSNVMESLRALGADFYFMQHGEDFIPPMMWRFLVADDIWVDRFIVRDADARLTQRDSAAVYAWIKSGFPFTCIRDHPSHAGYAVSGGLWGGKPNELRHILRRSWRDLMRGVPSHYLEDMNFLNKIIWPKVEKHAFCLDSVSCDKWPGSVPFPVPRYGYGHVGQVVNEHDLGRPIDLQILKNAKVNQNCSIVVTKNLI